MVDSRIRMGGHAAATQLVVHLLCNAGRHAPCVASPTHPRLPISLPLPPRPVPVDLSMMHVLPRRPWYGPSRNLYLGALTPAPPSYLSGELRPPSAAFCFRQCRQA